MLTRRLVFEDGLHTLQERGITDARTDAWMLFEHVTGLTRAAYLADPDTELSEQAAREYEQLISRRAAHEPVQYLTGTAWFMDHCFEVTPAVLIPRQDTETLVLQALEILSPMHQPRILDLCTGSGCIGLSLLTARPDATALLSDLSPAALGIARRNSRRLGVQDRAVFVCSDLFHELTDTGPFDLIATNPPYIATSVISGLMEEVRRHEPVTALDGGPDGLEFYRRILHDAPLYLTSGGWLLAEIGYDQSEAVHHLFQQAGFTGIQIIPDLAGHDRVVMGCQAARQDRSRKQHVKVHNPVMGGGRNIHV